MKINRIHINAFGKLKNFTLDLNSGMNVIYGNNEAGKTTLMNFIKMIFYGSASKSSDINKNPRRKYIPWDGSKMSGYIEFYALGTNYRLEREFGNSNTSDNITLFNLDTATLEPVSSKCDVGEQFFGLGASAFERSVFISNLSSVITGSEKDDEISKRLMNFATSCEENVSYELVRKRLTKAHEELRSKSGKTGSLDKLRQKVSEYSELISEADFTEQQKMSDELLHASLCEQLRNKKEYAGKISRYFKEQQIIRELHTLETQNRKNAVKQELQDKIDSLTRKISKGNFTVTDLFLDGCLQKISRINMLEKLYDEKKNEFQLLTEEIKKLGLDKQIQKNYTELDKLSDIKNEIKEKIKTLETDIESYNNSIDELKESMNETRIKEERYAEYLSNLESNNNSIVINYCIPVISFVIAVTALALKNFLILTAVIPADLILFFTAKIAMKFNNKNSQDETEDAPDYEKAYHEIETMLAEREESIKTAKENISQLNAEYAETDKKKIELEIENSKLISTNEQKIAEKSKLNSGLNSTNSEITQLNTELISDFSAYKNISDVFEAEKYIEEAQDILSEIDKTQAILNSKIEEDLLPDGSEMIEKKMKNLKRKLTALVGEAGPKLLSDEQTEVLETNLLIAEQEIEELNEKIMSLRSKIGTQYRSFESPALLTKKSDALKSRIYAMEKHDKSLLVAAEALEEAVNEIRQTFGPKLNTRTQKIFSHLTGGKYSEILVSKSLEINAAEQYGDSIHEWQYMSDGTAEQAYFSLRLAIADMITKNQIPLFLDDVFIQYDTVRARKGFEFISEYSRLNQVIFFTCHKYEEVSEKYIFLN